jgi:hypothetical protein
VRTTLKAELFPGASWPLPQARLIVDLGGPGFFCTKRGRDSTTREIQSYLDELRCRAETLATRRVAATALGRLGNYSQRLRAGLTCVAPTALGKTNVVGWTLVARGEVGHPADAKLKPGATLNAGSDPRVKSLRSEDLSYMKKQKSRRGRPSERLRTSRRYEKRMDGHSPAEAGEASSVLTKRNAEGSATRRGKFRYPEG